MDWESIVVNLITNASWALESKLAIDRKIKASIHSDGDNWVFSFHDSGVGLEAGTEKSVFLPTFSTKRSKAGEVIGTGMGLFIVRSFVEEHSGGSIAAISNGILGGASFEMVIPKASKH
nr:HAMP domain-containing sensor histidine kinase [Solimonas sp. SE-A11]